MGSTLEIVLIIVLVVANGVFSMSETAVVSARKARLQQRADSGDPRARAALGLADAPNIFLATVQVGITLIGILSGAFGGATIASRLTPLLAAVPALAPYADTLAVGLVVLVITYLSLVVGELVPKRIALNNPEGIAALVARPMGLLARLTAPVVWWLSVSTDALVALLRIRTSTEPPVTEEEIGVLLEQGARAGVFLESERDMVANVFAFTDQRVRDLMTPRPDIRWLDLEDRPEAHARTIAASVYSRFPVCRGDLDHVLGVVRAKDLLVRALAQQPLDLAAAMRHPLFVPESTPTLRVLERFRQTGEHLALVVDEYGGTAGLVTLNDVLEAIVGDVPAADEPDDPRALRRGDGSWLLDGALAVSVFTALLGIKEPPAGAGVDYRTLGGFVVACLGHIPVEGDRVVWAGLQFEVVDMDGNRVDKVLVAPLRETAGAAPDLAQ